MAITEDASTPAVVNVTGTAPTATTASFSPPAGSLLVAIVSIGYASGGDSPAVTVSYSGSHTWTAGPAIYSGSFSWVGIFTCYLSSAPGSITVGAHNSDATSNSGIQLALRVVNGAAASQAGAASGSGNNGGSTTTNISGSITTTAASSVVYVAGGLGSVFTITPTAATATIATTTPNGDYVLAGRSAAATVTPGAVTVGWTASSAGRMAWAALEVLPATAPGSLAEDASTPAVTHSSYGAITSATTGAFSPPANSFVVVAATLLHPGGGGGLTGSASEVADSLGNQYTPRCNANAVTGIVYSAIYSRFYSSAPGPITVTVTPAGTLTGASRDLQIAVRVLTGAASSQSGAATATDQINNSTETKGLTLTTAGSWAYFLTGSAGTGSQQQEAVGTKTVDFWSDSGQTNERAYVGVAGPFPAAGGTAPLLGWNDTGVCWAALEVLPATGLTINAPVATATGAAPASSVSITAGHVKATATTAVTKKVTATTSVS